MKERHEHQIKKQTKEPQHQKHQERNPAIKVSHHQEISQVEFQVLHPSLQKDGKEYNLPRSWNNPSTLFFSVNIY